MKENLKLTASGERVISEGQMTWLVDLVLMQNLVDARSTTSDPEAYIRALVATYDAADGLIKEYWQLIEHTGRESVALDVWRSGTYDLLSERGRAFVDRELGS